jgi:hypothetical protein
MPRNFTVDAESPKEVNTRDTGYAKKRVTVMLYITDDGYMLPPYIFLDRKMLPKNEMSPKDVIARVQKIHRR